MKWRRRTVLGLTILSGLLPGCASQDDRGGVGTRPTNILLITLDTTRADRLGCYGYPAATSPNLDALASRGALFEQAISSVALTRPAHATLLTGRLPQSHGVWSNGPYRLGPEWPTLAEHFEADFRTAGVVASYVLNRSFGLARGFESFDDRTAGAASHDPEKSAGEVVERFLGWLGDEVAPPFFVWLHFYDPHFPFAPPEPFASDHPDSAYDGEIAYMDDAIGRALTALRSRGWLEETLVVVTADHGEGLGEHGEPTHGYFLYDSTLRVPLILAGPGVPEKARFSQQVTLADIAPSVLDAFGLPYDASSLDGRSFWSELASGRLSERPAILENRAIVHQYGWSPLAGIRSGGWKWIEAPSPELYHLAEDPMESRNLVATLPEQARRLRAQWRRLRPADSQSRADALSPEEERRLRSLGYLAAAGPRSGFDPGTGPDPKQAAAAIPLIEDLTNARRGGSSAVAALIERILAVDPGNLFALRQYGQVLLQERRFAEAVAVLEGIVEGHATHPEAKASLGTALERTGDLQQARRYYEEALSPPWIYWPAVESLARLAARFPAVKPPGEVLEWLGGARPGTARERLSVARGYALLSVWTEAEAWFESSLEEDPDSAEARVGLAQMQAKLGRPDEALETLVRVRPETVESAFTTASVLRVLGREEEACAAFTRTSDLGATNANLLFGLGRGLRACGEHRRAVAALRGALSREPDRPDALFLLALSLEELGDRREASALYRRFLETAPPALGAERLEAGRRLRAARQAEPPGDW